MTKSQKMLAFAREQLGEIYQHGHHGDDEWDCSGLTMEMALLVGRSKIKWPHHSHYQWTENIKRGGDLPEHGTIDTMPLDKDVFLFKRGKRSNGEMGMKHVGAYDGTTRTQIQAGGNGKKVTVNGKRKSTVSEDAFTPSYWTHWGRGDWMDEEFGENAPTKSQGEVMPLLRNPSEGEHVRMLQNLLNKHITNEDKKLEVDGKFGPLTEAAVRAYQTYYGLDVDGVVGPQTWDSLLAKQSEEPTQPLFEVSYWEVLVGRTQAEVDKILERHPDAKVTPQN